MAGKYYYMMALILAAVCIAGALYYAIHVTGWLNEEAVTGFLEQYRNSPWGPLFVIGAYVLAGLTFFPVTIISLAVAAVFGPLWGIVYGMTGILISGAIVFTIGEKMRGREARQFIRRYADKYDKQLKESGVAGVAMLRMVVFAPFTIFNLICGLSSVRLTDFVVGSFIGLLPGFIARAIVGDSIIPLVFNPNVTTVSYLAIGLTLWVGIILLGRKLFNGGLGLSAA